MSTNPRTSNGHVRRENRRWLASLGFDCAICHKPIDYSLPAGDPYAFEMDECVPVSKFWLRLYNEQQQCWCGPYDSAKQAALARENMRATHRHCNRERSNSVDVPKDPSVQIFRSQEW